MPIKTTNILALDVGERRIGVAYASSIARLARPLTVLQNNDDIWNELAKILKNDAIGTIVVGLPRSLQGDETEQTRSVRSFVDLLSKKTDLPVVFQDEALTSRQAEAELRARGKHFAKGDIDALAATYILEDYLRTLAKIDTVESAT